MSTETYKAGIIDSSDSEKQEKDFSEWRKAFGDGVYDFDAEEYASGLVAAFEKAKNIEDRYTVYIDDEFTYVPKTYHRHTRDIITAEQFTERLTDALKSIGMSWEEYKNSSIKTKGIKGVNKLTEIIEQDRDQKQRLFVDMDGTLAVFNPVIKLEQLYEKGYFLNLRPISSVLSAVKAIEKFCTDKEVYILSSVLSDSPFAEQEKNEWLDKYLPEIPKERRIFLPCGKDKKEYIPNGVRSNDVLLDDYTNNLMLWEPPARGIKLLNGINDTRGTWKGNKLSWNKPPAVLAKDIVSVMNGIPQRDIPPQMVKDNKLKNRHREDEDELEP